MKNLNISLQGMIAFLVTVAFILIILVWMFFPPKGDAGSIAVLNTLVGSLAAAFGMVVSYFYGSSSGSKDKDDTIKAMSGVATTTSAAGVTTTANTNNPAEPNRATIINTEPNQVTITNTEANHAP